MNVHERADDETENRDGPEAMHHVDISPDFAELRTVRDFLRPLLTGTDDDNTLLLVAVTELVTNAIEAHHRVGSTQPIEIELDTDADTVTVRDQGDGHRPRQRRTGLPDADRGYGLALVETIRPNLTWTRNEPSGTIFVLPLTDR